MIKEGHKYVVTSDAWFVAPDGEMYRSAWGMCKVYDIEKVLGFRPSRPSTNWYLEIGCDGKEVIIAGCQIHHLVRCEDRPDNDRINQSYKHSDTGLMETANRIYIAEPEEVIKPSVKEAIKPTQTPGGK